jgi:ketosteroid isomerase-like protein
MDNIDPVLELEEELRRAQLTSDVQALDRLIDDDLVFVTIDGSVATKSDDLALHRSGRLRISRMDPVERTLMHLGTDTCVVSVRMDASAVLDGVEMTANLRYTRVWHKRSDGWRIVAGHMSLVPA